MRVLLSPAGGFLWGLGSSCLQWASYMASLEMPECHGYEGIRVLVYNTDIKTEFDGLARLRSMGLPVEAQRVHHQRFLAIIPYDANVV